MPAVGSVKGSAQAKLHPSEHKSWHKFVLARWLPRMRSLLALNYLAVGCKRLQGGCRNYQA